MSPTLGMGKRSRWDTTMSSFEKAWCMADSHMGLSPTAVPMMHRRGWSPARANRAAREYAGPGRRFHGSAPSGWKPMLVATMVGWGAGTPRVCLTGPDGDGPRGTVDPHARRTPMFVEE